MYLAQAADNGDCFPKQPSSRIQQRFAEASAHLREALKPAGSPFLALVETSAEILARYRKQCLRDMYRMP